MQSNNTEQGSWRQLAANKTLKPPCKAWLGLPTAIAFGSRLAQR